MKDDAVVPVEIKHVYDKDFKTHMAMGTGVVFTNNQYISIDFFIDELPVDNAVIQQNAMSGKPAKVVERRLLVRAILHKETALKLGEKMIQAHRIMLGPMPEE
jgi:hypothetical protein